jgi:hypothetical protein
MMEGVSSTMIYCKKFYKCHNVSWHNNNKKQVLKRLSWWMRSYCLMGAHLSLGIKSSRDDDGIQQVNVWMPMIKAKKVNFRLLVFSIFFKKCREISHFIQTESGGLRIIFSHLISPCEIDNKRFIWLTVFL